MYHAFIIEDETGPDRILDEKDGFESLQEAKEWCRGRGEHYHIVITDTDDANARVLDCYFVRGSYYALLPYGLIPFKYD